MLTFAVRDSVEEFIDLVGMVDYHRNRMRRFQSIDGHHILNVVGNNLLEHLVRRFRLPDSTKKRQ